jgi:hypothetical protein
VAGKGNGGGSFGTGCLSVILDLLVANLKPIMPILLYKVIKLAEMLVCFLVVITYPSTPNYFNFAVIQVTTTLSKSKPLQVKLCLPQ